MRAVIRSPGRRPTAHDRGLDRPCPKGERRSMPVAIAAPAKVRVGESVHGLTPHHGTRSPKTQPSSDSGALD